MDRLAQVERGGQVTVAGAGCEPGELVDVYLTPAGGGDSLLVAGDGRLSVHKNGTPPAERNFK